MQYLDPNAPVGAALTGPVEATKRNRPTAEGLSAMFASPPGDPLSWGALQGFAEDPSYGGTNDSIIDRPVQVAAASRPVSGASYLDVGNLGLTHDYFRTPAVAPGVSAIERAAPRNIASMFGPAYGDDTWGSGHLLDFSGAINAPGGAPVGGDPWNGGRIGGAGAGQPGLVTGRAVRPAAPPPTPVQNLASMFTPAAQPPLMSGDLYGANRGFGGENAQMPDSMNNSRWTGGY